MFRIKVRSQVAYNILHFHLELDAKRGDHWAVVGIISLHDSEWIEFLHICEANHIEVIVETTVSSESTEAAATDRE